MTNFPFTDPNTGLTFTGPYIAHGEVNIIPIQAVPDALGGSIQTEKNMHILGHSEDGNHHVLDRVEGVQRYRDLKSPDIETPLSSPIQSFLQVIADDVKLIHMGRGNHGEQVIPKGSYYVTTNVGYTPQGLQRDAD